jgi:hypothetical protein
LSTETTPKVFEDDTFFIQKKFLLSKNKEVVLTPPGLGLMKLIEKKKLNLSNLGLEKMCEVLPQLMAQDFPLAKEFIMNIEDKRITVIIQKSIFKGLYSVEKGSNSAKLFGCPIISAIGCILAQNSKKIITIDEIKSSKDMSTIQASYRIWN